MADPQQQGFGEALAVVLEEAPAGSVVRLGDLQFALQQAGQGAVILAALGIQQAQAQGLGALAQQFTHHQGTGGLKLRALQPWRALAS